MLNSRDEEILKTIHFYRYMTGIDVAHRLFSPGSRKHVIEVLSGLAGGVDHAPNRYLYRFGLPKAQKGNVERIFTLGARGKEVLESLGMPVEWYFRPGRMSNQSYGHIVHSLMLTRFLVAAHCWGRQQPDFRLATTRISYGLVGSAGEVIPDAWLRFERLRGGHHDAWFPVLLEVDRGTELQQQFKQHVRSRLEFIRSGAYEQQFGEKAVTIAYATTGQFPEYREARCRAMCAWTQEVLAEMRLRSWAQIFRFTSVTLEGIYKTGLFEEPVWLSPDSQRRIQLITLH